MKNKYMAWFIAICLGLIFYGLFSRYIALDAIYQLNRKETDIAPAYEIITVSGNIIEYYNI